MKQLALDPPIGSPASQGRRGAPPSVCLVALANQKSPIGRIEAVQSSLVANAGGPWAAHS